MNPDVNQIGNLTKKEWNARYWFSPLQMVTLINPKSEDFRFMVEMRHFMIKGGATEQMPGTVANVYLNLMTKILAQDEDKMQYLSDPNLMAQYYDRLISGVKSLMPEDNSQPAYLQNVPQSMTDTPVETPPWQQNSEPVEQQALVSPPPVPPKPVKPKAETKEFDYNGLKFKSVTDKEGVTTFFKNDAEIDEPTYAKAASML